PLVVALLLVATAAAFALTEGAKLQRPLISGTRVDATFSPVCGCSHHLEHITFRLLRRTRIAVSILNSSGAVVASLLRPRQFGLRVVRLVWNGREAPRASLAPTGHYFPEVFFPRLHRSLRLPSAITLDRVEPVIRRASLR